MKAITFDTEHAKKIELSIISEFGCKHSEIVSLRDSFVKKVAVFILSKTKNYNTRILGANYQISHLYIPTVISEIEYLIKIIPAFELKIKNIYERIENILD